MSLSPSQRILIIAGVLLLLAAGGGIWYLRRQSTAQIQVRTSGTPVTSGAPTTASNPKPTSAFPSSPVPTEPDSDSDGLSDAEEQKLGTDPHKADTDGDGVPDGLEVSYKTNPLVKDNTIAFSTTTTAPNVATQLRQAEQARIGSAQATGTAVTPPVQTTVSTLGATDLDHDGLTYDQEQQLGTDPNNPDSDGDGLSDGDEITLYKTNPLKADSDGDGYPDGTEVKSGYNPLGAGKCAVQTCIP